MTTTPNSFLINVVKMGKRYIDILRNNFLNGELFLENITILYHELK
jgi:hypothetical protein